MKDAATRIRHYNNRMSGPLLTPVVLAVSGTAKANFAKYAEDFVPYQIAERELIGAAGVPVIDIAAYEAYTGELYSATKRLNGQQLADEWAILVAKWSDTAHLGATAEATLEAIGLNVFHLDLTGALT